MIDLSPRKWTVEEYNKMAECGVIAPDERVELIDGEVVPLSAHDKIHSDSVALATNVLVRLYGDTHLVRVGLPIQVGEYSEPEPDFALVKPEHQTESGRHPTKPDLVIEVSYTSLSRDRMKKVSLYASASIPEYWIVNLWERCLERHLEPKADKTAPFGFSYARREVLGEDDSIQPVKIDGEAVAVKQLMAPERSR
jgi:Uma2 family endonuclease